MWTDHGLKIMQRGSNKDEARELREKIKILEAEIDLLRGKLHEARRAAREKLFPVPKGRDDNGRL